MKNTIRLILATATLLLSSASPALAGSGEINNGKLDLLVYFDYAESDPSTWEPLFDKFSELLLNATEGGLQLGTVSFTQCRDQKDQADIWVRSTAGGASAHRNGLGVPGRHMFLSQTHKSVSGDVLGQFGLLHEAGHYLWGCYDEYKGYVGHAAATLDEQFCSASGDTVSCPMDGGAAVALNNERTEFCTASAHAFEDSQHNNGSVNALGVAVRTTQEYHLAQSCWERIEASGNGGLSAPAAAPSQDQPTHQAVIYDAGGFQGSLAISLVIDTSGSMQQQNKMQLAKAGAAAGVGLMNDGDQLSLVRFNNTAQVIVPTTTINSGTKNQFINALNSLNPGGGTAIGAGMISGQSQLLNATGCKRLIVLLSDGVSTSLPAGDDGNVLGQLQATGVQVFAIALGNQPAEQELIAATIATGGKLFKAVDPTELPGIFSAIFAEAAGSTTVASVPDQLITANQSATQTFDISDFSTSARVVLNHQANANLSVVLTAPSGAVIDSNAPSLNETVFISDVQLAVTIPNPESGTWTATINEQQGVDSGYDFLAFVESAQLKMTASVAQSTVSFPEPTHLEVSVVAGVPVGGAAVSADVTRPDGTLVNITLHDDGLSVHGDSDADDGIYSALFTRYNGNGNYSIDVHVDNAAGEGAASMECVGFGEDGVTSEPIAPFVARVAQSVLVSDFTAVPNAGSVGVIPHLSLPELDTVQVNSSSPTAVAGFALEVGTDEAVILQDLAFDLGDVEKTDSEIALLQRLALHIDQNGDGKIDEPSVPLALAQVVDNTLRFAQPSGEMLMLDADTATHFIMTAGDGLVLPSVDPAAPPASTSTAGVDTMPILALGLLASALGIFLLCAPTRRAQRRLAWALSLAICLSLNTGCSRFLNSSSSGGHGAATVDFSLSLRSTDVSAEGAVSGADATVSGADVPFEFTLQ